MGLSERSAEEEPSIAEGRHPTGRPSLLEPMTGSPASACADPATSLRAAVDGAPARGGSSAGDRRWERAVGLLISGLVLLVFLVSNPARHNFYEHFTWQAAAWLEGETGIRYPVCPSSGEPIFEATTCQWVADPGQPYNDYFLDVMPVTGSSGRETGRATIPFPPLPALVLLPFVALWGLNFDAQSLAALIGGLDVWIAWWMLGALALSLRMRAAVTLFFGLGTVFWYTSMLGTTWYFAHVVAVGLVALALGIALRTDGSAVAEAAGAEAADATAASPTGASGETRTTRAGLVDGFVRTVRHRPWTLVEPRQFLAGFIFGLACLARLTVVFGLPFLALVGGGGSTLRRGFSAGLGAALPVLGLVAYNVLTTGHIFHPAYEYLYQREAVGYPDLDYNPRWAIEDLRYFPKNVALMLAGGPDIMPACPPSAVRSLFSDVCPIVVPKAVGMSLLLSSPAYLLVIPALQHLRRSRLVLGAAIAVTAIAFVNLMHFSQGWVQFGYRFSNDFAPFALILVALGLRRFGRVGAAGTLLIGASILINLWGVAWGVILGW